MPISNTLQPPSWVDSGAEFAGGLDLLGLRLPVQNIGGTLLDGITTVTPSVRYLSFRAWLILRYGQSGLPDRWQDFTDFSARIESALVLGNLAQDRSISGLIGADQALERLVANTPQIAISPLVKSPASTIYTGPSDQLGITKSRDEAVPQISLQRGLPIAEALERSLTSAPLVDRLLTRQALTSASIDDLLELGAVARIDQIPREERELLLAAIIPDQPRAGELARIGTYAALLALARSLSARPTESDLFNAAGSVGRFGEPLLDEIADGWTTYSARDVIAVTQEAVLSAVIGEMIASPNAGQGGVEQDAIIEGLMARVEEHDSALRDLDLLESGESIASLSFCDLQSRVDDRLSPGSKTQNGICRWPHALSEQGLYRRAMRSGAGALTLAVVAWLLAAKRVGTSVREGTHEHWYFADQGRRRMGLRDVILPELDRFQREDRPLREVAAELGYLAVQQHMQITWSRLQVDITRDVALLTAEGNRWFSRGKGFSGGRTASRLLQALGWLEQLGLLDQGGLTADGEIVLHRALETLSRGAAA